MQSSDGPSIEELVQSISGGLMEISSIRDGLLDELVREQIYQFLKRTDEELWTIIEFNDPEET